MQKAVPHPGHGLFKSICRLLLLLAAALVGLLVGLFVGLVALLGIAVGLLIAVLLHNGTSFDGLVTAIVWPAERRICIQRKIVRKK